ncbi:MAG: DUF1801 domain-containing protein, partial [Propionibacteriaceae bacterium]|jgi:uncharacterized protein YdhG (YjbR/CyaY superfamily)|nr:DUF1801 domain-containing protein [Propionibacteriaceae bacterium]
VAERLEVLRALIHEAAPGVTEKMTYRMPTFVLNGNLMYFAGCARHVGLYPLPQGVTAFTDRLQELGLAFSKGAIQLPHDRPLPLDLVRDIVAYRVAQQQK